MERRRCARRRALFERHFESVYRFFCNKVPRDADDLVQETFLECVGAKERFRQDASFRTFLFAIARKVLLKYRERWARATRARSSTPLGSPPSISR
ncbi:RNA polymerase sigma factor [Nannocystis pusilla]|uniref:RNA polymerase sigma factor n=1 Tax=Nannocystis pusilla TaxID=889268 RepID=UPI003B837F78